MSLSPLQLDFPVVSILPLNIFGVSGPSGRGGAGPSLLEKSSVLQYVAVCCSVLLYVLVFYSVLRCVVVCCRMLQYVAGGCIHSLLQCQCLGCDVV